MLGISGFKTKKGLREVVGEAPSFIETSFFGAEVDGDGEYTVVGPDPDDRRWYAVVTVKDGLIKAVT